MELRIGTTSRLLLGVISNLSVEGQGEKVSRLLPRTTAVAINLTGVIHRP